MHRQALATLAVMLAVAASLSAKGPTVRLEITGGGLAKPITVTDSGVLAESNVYFGTFLGPITDAATIDPAWPKYVVSFFVDLQPRIEKKYVVYYVKNPKTGQGFVYLPGSGEDLYKFNGSTILRNGLEGNWLGASSRWANGLNSYLP